MTITKARSVLLSIFVISFLLITLLIIIPFIKGEYGSESLLTLVKKILVVYSVHFGVIAGGIFGKENPKRTLTSGLSFRLAFVMALIWNILLVWRCVAFTFIETDTTDEEIVNYIDTIAPASSFLISGALVFFFTNQK